MMTKRPDHVHSTSHAGGAAVIFQTDPEAQMRMPRSGVRSLAGADTHGLAAILDRHTVTAGPVFGPNEDRLAAVAGTHLDDVEIEIPDLSGYYRVRSTTDALSDLAAELRNQEGVAAAWVEPIGVPPLAGEWLKELRPDPPPRVTPNLTSKQGYLEAAPLGVDARYAWTLDGGGGATVRIFDVENGGWKFTHEDLRTNQGGAVGDAGGDTLGHRNHATAVVGVLGGDRNAFGITGLAPEASVRGSFASTDGVPAAIRAATDLLGTGDLILIEAHAAGPRFDFKAGPPIMDTTTSPPRVLVELPGYIAMEWWPSVYQATKYAAAHGVIVVAAAGNGAEDLDDDLYDTPGVGFPDWWVNPFRRSAGHDSRAIVVGAGASPNSPWGGPPRSRLPFSNYGSVVDAQGWGSEVVTTGYGDFQGGIDEHRWYTGTFAGTSSALPVVAGALACVQGALSAHIFDRRLDAAQARRLLRTTGTPQTEAPGRPVTQRIGNLPSIGQLLPGPVIYAVTPDRFRVDGRPRGGDLLWYRHLGRRDGSEAWAAGPRTLTAGWNRVQAFSGRGGVIYSIDNAGDLYWRRHIGAGDGANTWSAPVAIGSGWDFTHVFAAAGGSIYAVRKFGIDPVTGEQVGGNLLMYEHLGWSDGTPRWNGDPQLVGTGWNFDHIFAGDDGRVYAITRTGELWRYIHTGRGVRSKQWEPAQQIGHGWKFEHVFYGGDQVIYAIDDQGNLYWDRDDGSKNPASGPPTKRVGHGWDFSTVFAS